MGVADDIERAVLDRGVSVMRDLCDDVRRLSRGQLPEPEVFGGKNEEVQHPALRVECPRCFADEGSPCVGVQWDRRLGVKGEPHYADRAPHAARIKAAKR